MDIIQESSCLSVTLFFKLLTDKSHEKRLGMEIINSIQRTDGKRKLWKAGGKYVLAILCSYIDIFWGFSSWNIYIYISPSCSHLGFNVLLCFVGTHKFLNYKLICKLFC